MMWHKIGLAALVVGLLLCLLGAGGGLPEVYFEMADPAGDDYGYGAYEYPTNLAFEPYQGLFDILNFKVWCEQAGNICFDTKFAKVTNPWMAPEGFIHQNLRIYIDTKPNSGQVIPAQPGANVSFNSKHGWEYCLKVVGWNNSKLQLIEDGKLKIRSLKTELLEDGQTIRASVPTNLIGRPESNWRYYVFVGSYDGFGEDFFRKVSDKPGAWVIGGGMGKGVEPRLLDILAPKEGRLSQEKQLTSFDVSQGKLGELHPVGLKGSFSGSVWLGMLLLAILGGASWFIRQKTQAISWFWVKGEKPKDPQFK